MARPRVLIVGAGFAGFHGARELERLLRPDEAELVLASPVDYMLYSPLLPQVAAGVITPQAAAVSLRRALRRTLRAPCSVTGIDLDARTCVAQAVTGEVHTVHWDYLVLCPGAVTRTFGTPGGEQHGRGMKTLAQATHLHDHVLAELELGNAVRDEQRRAYAGPRYFIRHAELDMHPLDTGDRRQALREEHGLGLCNITKCCTEVCPAEIKITDNAIIPMKERSADQRYDPLGRVLRSWRHREGRPPAG
jgi:pyridine nucleotide-disulfide oxidoreductase